MKGILVKELRSYFSSIVGYIIIGIFLIISSLFLWVFNDTSILKGPFANLDQLFFMAPYLFLFIIPAMTMRSFADEYQRGTIELLYTKPISLSQIIMGKYFACLVIVLITVFMTLIYYYALNQLASPPGFVDHGSIIGSYIGMFLLGAAFIAIGLFASSSSNNQVSAFLVAVIFCFTFFWGFYYLSSIPIFVAGLDIFIERLGIDYHYEALSRGVLDSRDVSYFVFVIVFFLVLTYIILDKRK